MFKGTIALDIDGTITARDHLIPDGVAIYFERLYEQGWQFIFVTGRPFSFAMMTLTKLSFPFLLALQNGADLLEMPGKKRVKRSYFKIDVVHLLEELYEGHEGDFLVYAGFEKGDLCYYRPERYSKEMLIYLKDIEKFSASPWIPLKDFNIKEQSTFPLVKCMGKKQDIEQFNEKLLVIKEIKTSMIRDPFSPAFYLLLITHHDADKGIAVATFMDRYQLSRPLITGGDDNNDIPLLKKGDIRIAMDGAPEALQSIAHIIAPPADRMGIIQGLEEAFAL